MTCKSVSYRADTKMENISKKHTTPSDTTQSMVILALDTNVSKGAGADSGALQRNEEKTCGLTSAVMMPTSRRNRKIASLRKRMELESLSTTTQHNIEAAHIVKKKENGHDNEDKNGRNGSAKGEHERKMGDEEKRVNEEVTTNDGVVGMKTSGRSKSRVLSPSSTTSCKCAFCVVADSHTTIATKRSELETSISSHTTVEVGKTTSEKTAAPRESAMGLMNAFLTNWEKLATANNSGDILPAFVYKSILKCANSRVVNLTKYGINNRRYNDRLNRFFMASFYSRVLSCMARIRNASLLELPHLQKVCSWFLSRLSINDGTTTRELAMSIYAFMVRSPVFMRVLGVYSCGSKLQKHNLRSLVVSTIPILDTFRVVDDIVSGAKLPKPSNIYVPRVVRVSSVRHNMEGWRDCSEALFSRFIRDLSGDHVSRVAWNKLMHALNGNISMIATVLHISCLFLDNYLRHALMEAESVATSMSTRVHVCDFDFSVGYDTHDRHAITYYVQHDKIFMPMVPLDKCDDHRKEVIKRVRRLMLRPTDTAKCHTVGSSSYTAHSVGFTYRKPEQTCSAANQALSQCMMMLSSARLHSSGMSLSKMIGQRVYIYDRVGFFPPQSVRITKKILYYEHSMLYSVSNPYIVASLSDVDFRNFILLASGTADIHDDLDYDSLLLSMNVFVDEIGWYVCDPMVMSDGFVTTTNGLVLFGAELDAVRRKHSVVDEDIPSIPTQNIDSGNVTATDVNPSPDSAPPTIVISAMANSSQPVVNTTDYSTFMLSKATSAVEPTTTESATPDPVPEEEDPSNNIDLVPENVTEIATVYDKNVSYVPSYKLKDGVMSYHFVTPTETAEFAAINSAIPYSFHCKTLVMTAKDIVSNDGVDKPPSRRRRRAAQYVPHLSRRARTALDRNMQECKASLKNASSFLSSEHVAVMARNMAMVDGDAGFHVTNNRIAWVPQMTYSEFYNTSSPQAISLLNGMLNAILASFTVAQQYNTLASNPDSTISDPVSYPVSAVNDKFLGRLSNINLVKPADRRMARIINSRAARSTAFVAHADMGPVLSTMDLHTAIVRASVDSIFDSKVCQLREMIALSTARDQVYDLTGMTTDVSALSALHSLSFDQLLFKRIDQSALSTFKYLLNASELSLMDRIKSTVNKRDLFALFDSLFFEDAYGIEFVIVHVPSCGDVTSLRNRLSVHVRVLEEPSTWSQYSPVLLTSDPRALGRSRFGVAPIYSAAHFSETDPLRIPGLFTDYTVFNSIARTADVTYHSHVCLGAILSGSATNIPLGLRRIFNYL